MYKENEYKQMKMEILIQNEMNKMKMKTEHDEHIIMKLAFAYCMDFMDFT